jgi:large subunit ribosomal protein L14
MIQQQTILKVSDNSGAKIAKCIKILGGFKKKFARAGDTIVVAISHLRNRSKKTSKVKKGGIYKALIIRTKNRVKNKEETFTFFNDNAVSLLNKQNNPLATRIVGPVSKKLKIKYMKFASISAGFA